MFSMTEVVSLKNLEQTVKHILSSILTIEANVCLPPKLAIFRVNGKTKLEKMDFLQNSTTLMSLFMNINDVTHLINVSDFSCSFFAIEMFFLFLQLLHGKLNNILNAGFGDIYVSLPLI